MSSLMLLLLLLLAMDSSVMELAADTADLSKQILAETSALNDWPLKKQICSKSYATHQKQITNGTVQLIPHK